jgi:shikimate dehydrogenase
LDRYAVFGNPIGHSKSPFIHTQFALALGEQLQYQAILAPVDNFADSWREFVQAGGKGANVTVPFKQQAYQLAQHLTERAKQAQAVNTLYIDGQGKLCADNTDGIGLVMDLQRLQQNLTNSTILILGAGGATRGVIGPLLQAGVARIVIANRTLSKAQAIADSFTPQVQAAELQQIPDLSYNIIINATSSGLTGQRPDIASKHVHGCQLVYDMVYAAEPTAFLTWAKQSGAKQQADGLGMLVAQAAESFYIWRGKKPNIAPVLAALTKQLAKQLTMQTVAPK